MEMEITDFCKRLWMTFLAVFKLVSLPTFMCFVFWDVTSFDATWYNIVTGICLVVGIPPYFYMMTFTTLLCTPFRRLDVAIFMVCVQSMCSCCIFVSLFQGQWIMLAIAIGQMCFWGAIAELFLPRPEIHPRVYHRDTVDVPEIFIINASPAPPPPPPSSSIHVNVNMNQSPA